VSALLGGDGEEGGGLLVDVFAATLGTLEASLLIFREAKDHFKRFLAMFAVELITRHGDLPEKRLWT
jgi:hypothetical protein